MNIAQLLTTQLTEFDFSYYANILNELYKEKYVFSYEKFNGEHYLLLTVTHILPGGKIEETLIEHIKNADLISLLKSQITLVNNAERHYNRK